MVNGTQIVAVNGDAYKINVQANWTLDYVLRDKMGLTGTKEFEVDITRIVNVNDVGKVISVEGCQGQQYGGSVMGLGRGFTEDVVHDPNTGVILNGNLLNYKIPTMMEVGSFDSILVETGMSYGQYGVVGIGEDVATILPTLIGVAQCHRQVGGPLPGDAGCCAESTGKGLSSIE